MRRVNHFRVWAAILATGLLALMMAMEPAEAAFPGANGQIVFHSNRSIVVGDPSTTDTEIFSMNPNGTGLTQLTVNAAQDFNPAWSPDGTEIAFESRHDGNDEIFKMAANGFNQRRLTSNAADDTGAAWSPGGTKIEFVSDRNVNGDDEIYVMNANGASQQNTTFSTANESDPDWQPGS